MTAPDSASAALAARALPPLLLSTLRALKTLPRLEAALDEHAAAMTAAAGDEERAAAAGHALDAAARPLLLDAGAGKKGTEAALAALKQPPAAPVPASAPAAPQDKAKKRERRRGLGHGL